MSDHAMVLKSFVIKTCYGIAAFQNRPDGNEVDSGTFAGYGIPRFSQKYFFTIENQINNYYVLKLHSAIEYGAAANVWPLPGAPLTIKVNLGEK